MSNISKISSVLDHYGFVLGQLINWLKSFIYFGKAISSGKY